MPASSDPGARPGLPGSGEAAADSLLFRRIPAGSVLWRVHRADRDPVFYGDSTVDYRFNDPGPGATHPAAPAAHVESSPDAGAYGVWYLGFTPAGAFVETFLRRAARHDVARSEIDARRLTEVRVVRDLRLVQLDGPGLSRAGVEAAVVSGPDYTLSRTVSRLLWRRRDTPDGILYAARHDNHLYSAAIFDRARSALACGTPRPIDDDLLRELIARYRFGLL